MYLHYEGLKSAAFTCKMPKSARDQPLDSVVAYFVQQHGNFTRDGASSSSLPSSPSTTKALQAECLELQLEAGEKLSRYGSTVGACFECLSAPGAATAITDVFLVDCATRKVVFPSAPPTAVAAVAAAVPPAAPAADTQPKAAASRVNAGGVTPESIKATLKEAREYYAMKAYKNARVLVSEKVREVQLRGMSTLSEGSGARVTKDCSLLEFSSEIMFKTGKFEQAAEFAETAVEHRSKIGPKNSSGSTARYLNYLVAKCHFKADNHEDSWAALKSSRDGCNMKKQASTAMSINEPHPHFHLDICALEAELLFAMGKHQQAAEIVNNTMADPMCEKHVGVLLAYSSFASQYGKYEEAIRALLKAVVLDQTDKKGKKMLSQLLNTTTGMEEMLKQLPPSENAASAYAFLATICKDHSCILASKRLLEYALQQKPMSASYVGSHYALSASLSPALCVCVSVCLCVCVSVSIPRLLNSKAPSNPKPVPFYCPTNNKQRTNRYALNLMHVIELQGDGAFFDQSIKVVEGFLLLNKNFLKVGKSGFSAKELYQALQVQDSSSDSGKTVVSWLQDAEDKGDAGTADGGADGAVALEPSVQGGCVVTMPLLHSTFAEVDGTISDTYTLGAIHMSESDINPDASACEEYDADSLDLLAIAFTLVKMLYLQGKLHRLGALFKIIEPSRRRSSLPIHQTTVRNEHAYYQTVAQVMAYRLSCASESEDITSDSSMNGKVKAIGCGMAPLLASDKLPAALRAQYAAQSALESKSSHTFMTFPVSPVLRNPAAACCNVFDSALYKKAAARPIYVVGDSHTVPMAWNVIRVASSATGKTEHRLLVPKLVTGVKQYHLRKDSDFYPKAQFAAMLKSIPDGSDVLFILGEIDCREGILVGVQKDAYENVRQGMERTILHFAAVLPNLVQKRKMNISIHPVLPMLKETRDVVCEFNKHYCKAMQTRIPAPGVQWLDFFDELVTGVVTGEGKADGDACGTSGTLSLALRPGLRMDGTHITPAYVSLIEAAMHKADASSSSSDDEDEEEDDVDVDVA